MVNIWHVSLVLGGVASLVVSSSFQPLEVRSGACSAGQKTIKAPHANVWHALTEDEQSDVNKFLYSKASGLNLTTPSGPFGGSPNDNTLLGMDLLAPNKSDVLAYLSGKTSAPDRYAHATILFGATKDMYQQDFILGPLPVSDKTKLIPRSYPSRKDGKLNVIWNIGTTLAFADTVKTSASKALKSLWNMTDTQLSSVNLGKYIPPEVVNGRNVAWLEFTGNPTGSFDSGTLLPLGLYVRTDTTGRDTSKWNVTGWLYNNIFYPDLDTFTKAMATPGFVRLGINIDGPWAQTDRQGDRITLDEQPPPESVQPGQQRFTIDDSEKYVSWMDFSFFISRTRNTGVKLFDINYKGKRIIFELGMEEALAHYASNNPIHSRTLYFDSYYAFGGDMVSLVPGYDCPAHATYLNFSAMTGGFGGTSGKLVNGLCMFEMDQGYPLRRHTSASLTSISKNIAFIVRSVATVGNYDYMVSYEFYMDGSILVSIRASGYIESAYWAHNEDYGFKIHDNLSGSLHDHVLTFKADFDILGEKNSLQKIQIVPTTETYAWSEGRKLNTMKAVKSFVITENESKINWSPNGDTMYAIVNKDQKTALGEYPGYRISPASGVIYLTVNDSSIGQNALHQASHHLFVTKQKDSEARASDPYNLLDTQNPLVNFDSYFDGESLDQEDLVVWFNLGMHHMPHSGDLPNTMFTTAHSSVLIQPLNYLPGDPSSASTQQIRINTDINGNKISVTRFGAVASNCSIDMSLVGTDHNLLT